MRPASSEQRCIPWCTLALAATALAVAAWPGAAAALEWRPDAWAAGQPWRALTGHLAHFTGRHLALDVAMLLGLGLAVERLAPRRSAAVLLASALAIPALLPVWAPELSSYRGLSGLASGLFALLVTLLARSAAARRRWLECAACGALGALFVAKTVREVLTGEAVFMGGDGGAGSAPFVVVPLAHAVAALCGVVIGSLGPGRCRAAVSGSGKSHEVHTPDVTAPAGAQ